MTDFVASTEPRLPPPADAPPGFHLLAKPSGSTCNLDCTYCFFLSKEALYPSSKCRMSEATLEAYIRQLLESHVRREVTVAWQGGEPTLMGWSSSGARSSSSKSTATRPDVLETPSRPTASC